MAAGSTRRSALVRAVVVEAQHGPVSMQRETHYDRTRNGSIVLVGP